MDIRCTMVKAIIKDFFNGKVAPKVKDMIIAHLLSCHNCEDVYINYAMEIGLVKWSPLNAAKKFIAECGEDDFLCERTNLALDGLDINYSSDSELKFDQWTRAAKAWNIGKLKKVKAFSDLIINMDYLVHKSDEDKDDHVEFLRYETKKICQKIDHLELCLAKSEDKKDA